MKRLRDGGTDLEPALRELATLVDATPPSRPDERRRQRVRLALSQARRRGVVGLLPRLAVILVLVAAFAFAAIWRGRARPAAPLDDPSPRPSGPLTLPASPLHELPMVQAPPVSTAPSSKRAIERVEPAKKGPARTVVSGPETPGPIAQGEDAFLRESRLITEAVQKLRRDRDPAAAETRLNEYLATFPSGQLVEEARALSIEAADARSDPRAAALGADYLRRFPEGRFRDAARTAIEKFSTNH